MIFSCKAFLLKINYSTLIISKIKKHENNTMLVRRLRTPQQNLSNSLLKIIKPCVSLQEASFGVRTTCEQSAECFCKELKLCSKTRRHVCILMSSLV